MQLLKKLIHKFDGLRYPQEYICLTKESLQLPLHVYIVNGQVVLKDITDQHIFTGYSPLIFTLHSSAANHLGWPAAIDVVFSAKALQLNEFLREKDALARVSLKMIHKQSLEDLYIAFYEGIHGEHRFISSFHQYMTGLYNRWYNKKPGNVFLNDNLYKQVQIAYSVPRIISLITVGNADLFNLFPTDLHGPLTGKYYVSSLRHEGKACKQVESTQRIVISEIHADAYKQVYGLGKNHMQGLKTKDHFPLSHEVSELFQLPIPQAALYYRELELADSFEHGIHKLLLYKVVGSKQVNPEAATLSHVHNVYATWRHNKGLAGNYLLR